MASRLFWFVAFVLTATASTSFAGAREDAYRITALHLITAKLCSPGKGQNAGLERAIRIGETRLMKAGYGRSQADFAVTTLVTGLNAISPKIAPPKKVRISQLRQFEHR